MFPNNCVHSFTHLISFKSHHLRGENGTQKLFAAEKITCPQNVQTYLFFNKTTLGQLS